MTWGERADCILLLKWLPLSLFLVPLPTFCFSGFPFPCPVHVERAIGLRCKCLVPILLPTIADPFLLLFLFWLRQSMHVLCERGNKKVFIRRMTCLSEYVREPCRGRTFHTSSQGKKCNKAWSTAIYRTASVFSCQPSKCWVLGGLKAASLHRVHLTPCTFPLSSASRKVQCWLFPWLSHLYILLFHDSLFSRFK